MLEAVRSKSKASTRALYWLESTTRERASMPSFFIFCRHGEICGWNSSEESRNSKLSGCPFGSSNCAPSRLQPAASRRSNARFSKARSEPEPSETGGSHGSPNTSSGTLPRHGSSSFNSSGDGGPLASIAVFWNRDVTLL